MYPVLIRRLADLRVGDRLIAHSGQRYPQPLRVVAPLGALPGSHGRGVRVQNPTPDGPSVLYPCQMDGQVLEIDRPTHRCADDEHSWTEVGKPSPCGYRSWVCIFCPERTTTITGPAAEGER